MRPAAAPLACLCLLAATACAQTPRPAPGGAPPDAHPPVITVTGRGTVEADPDRANVSVGVSASAPDAASAQHQVNSAISKIIAEVKQLEIPGAHFQTSSLTLYPVYEQRNPRTQQTDQPPRIIGYNARNTLGVRIDDIDRVGDVIDEAIESGATEINSVMFDIRDRAGAHRQALARAVGDASSKAQTIADAAGTHLGPIVEIREGAAPSPLPYRAERGMAMSMMADAAPTSGAVEAGTIIITATVTGVWRIGDR